MRSFPEVINDYLCGRSKTLKQGDYGKQESDNDGFEIINSRIFKGTSKRMISEILNLSRTSIDVYLGRMGVSGMSAEELLHSDDKTLSQVMVRESGHRNTYSEKLDELSPLLEDYARQMQLRNMTYQLLFENYR